MRIHIKNGLIIDPANNIESKGDIYVVDGKIIGVNTTMPDFTPDKTIDATDKLVLPGLVDLCARYHETLDADIQTINKENLASAHGGITTACCPPDIEPIIDSISVVELLNQRINTNQYTRLLPIAALTDGLKDIALSEMTLLKKAGCIAASNGKQAIQNSEILRCALAYAKHCQLPVMLFCEDNDLRNQGVVHESAYGTRMGLPMIPVSAETVAISRALLLAEASDYHIHICRISSAHSVEIIQAAQQRGLNVTADVAITHLHLNDVDTLNYNVQCHLRPPLRSQTDQQALITGIKNGVINAVCSDHQPLSKDEKLAPFSQTKPGAATIELLLPLMLHLANNHDITISDALRLITHQPAEIIQQPYGTLSIGSEADICIFDPNNEWQVNHDTLLTQGENCPFLNWHLQGQVSHTLLSGNIIFSTT